MNQEILFLNLTKSFIHLNLFSYDELGYINLSSNFKTRIPQYYEKNEAQDLKREIELLIDDEFLAKYKTSVSKVHEKYIFPSKGSNTYIKKLLEEDYQKVIFSSAIKHNNVTALLRSQKLSGVTFFIYDDSGAKLLTFKLGKNDNLEVKVDKIYDDFVRLFGEKQVQEELKTVWARVQKYNDDFDLFLNSENIHSYGISEQKDLLLTKFLFDSYIYKNIKKVDLEDINLRHPLILSGSRYARDNDSNYILYSLLASLNKDGIYDVYLDNNLAVFNLLSIDLAKGSFPDENFLEKNTEKYLNVKLNDEKKKYKEKEPVASLNISGNEIYPYKNSMWGILTDSNTNVELNLKLMRGINIGNMKDRQVNLKNLKGYSGVVVSTLDVIPSEYEELSEWQDKILEHFELK